MGADHTAGVTLFPGLDGSNKAAQVSLSGMIQAFFAAIDNLMCIFAMSSLAADSRIAPGLLAGLYGGPWNMGRLLGIGVQTLSMERFFNRGAGFTEKDDRLPEFFYKEFSPATGAVFDISPEEMAAVFNY
jgi:aldehyde:ferredoxin oxidoreductase